jgi:hypothetical protein
MDPEPVIFEKQNHIESRFDDFSDGTVTMTDRIMICGAMGRKW